MLAELMEQQDGTQHHKRRHEIELVERLHFVREIQQRA